MAIEDFQVSLDTDAPDKAGAKENLRRILSDYCREYMSLYLDSRLNRSLEDLHGQDIAVDHWTDQAIRSIGSHELDECKIQCDLIRQSFERVFHSQYRKMESGESLVSFTDDSGREVIFTAGDTGAD